MKPSAAVLALCELSLFAALAAAQSAPAPAPGPTIRATASEVLLDVVVRDKRGKPVNNLKPGEVEIYEDGVRQEVKSFRFVGSREAQSPRAAIAGAPAQRQAQAAPRPLKAVNLVCIVFHNLDPVSRTRAIEAVQEFLKSDLPPETYIGLFLLDDHLTPVHPFTNNRAELARAVQNVFSLAPLDFASASVAVLTANPTQATISVAVDMASHTATADLRVSGGEISKTAITGADVSTGLSANIMRGNQVTEQRDFSNISGMRETDKIITMIDSLGGLPGRKVVLLVTTGLVTNGDPDRFQAILNKANQSGISVYPLSAIGLDETSTSSAANIALSQAAGVSRSQTQPVANGQGALSAAKEKSRMGDTVDNAVRSSDVQSSLRELAEGTGGFLIANTNDFRKPFQRVVEDVDAHYEAAYRPASNKYDGRLRQIEVKLTRAGLSAESRRGYFDMPDLQGSAPLAPFETIGLALLNTKPLPHAFDYSSAAFHFQAEGTNTHGALVFELPGTALVATAKTERLTHVFHVSLVALVKDSSGQIVDKFGVDAPYEIPDANLELVRANSLLYSHPLSLPPGHYTVETVVMDREGGRASANVSQLDRPGPQKGIALSSAMLIQRVEPVVGQPDPSDPFVLQTRRLVPYVNAKLAADANPYAYFVVYPDKASAEKPQLQVEFRVAGQVLANQTSDLPAPDASGAIPMMIRAATHAGDCELKITAVQGSESAVQTIAYTVGK
jgi:VWFA-related protein